MVVAVRAAPDPIMLADMAAQCHFDCPQHETHICECPCLLPSTFVGFMPRNRALGALLYVRDDPSARTMHYAVWLAAMRRC